MSARLPRSGHVEAVAKAPAEAVWAVLADVTRTGEWSHETTGAVWLDGHSSAVPGARVRGSNKQGRTRWHRICEFTTVNAPNELRWRTVSTALFPDSSEWSFRLTTQDDGSTRIEQSFEVLRLNRVFDHLYWLLVPAHRDRTAALAADLARLAGVAETEAHGVEAGKMSNEPSRPADC